MNNLKNVFSLSSSSPSFCCNCRSNSPDPPTTTSTRRSSEATNNLVVLPKLPKGLRSPPPPPPRPNHNNPTDVLRLMDSLQFPVPVDTYASLLRECALSGDAAAAADVHSHIQRAAPRRRRSMGLLLSNRLLLAYASCGRLDEARELFDKMTIRDSISWLTIIAAHFHHNDPQQALILFNQMKLQLHQPEMQKLFSLESRACKVIMSSLLKACILTKDFFLGQQLHGLLLKFGGHAENLFLCSLFIGFYAKFRCLESARRVFDQALCRSRPDTVVWTAMMSGYSKEGCFEEVIELFKEMGRENTKKNNFTISTVLRACGRIHGDDDYDRNGGRWCGRQVHGNAIKLGVVESDVFVQSSLVDMYGKCGLLEDARKAFEMIDNNIRNDVCWHAMLDGYTRHGLYSEAIKLLYSMKAQGIQPKDSMLDRLRMAFDAS